MPLISSDVQATVTLATDIAIVISLVVVAIQVYLQRKATKYNTYEKLMSDFSANASLLIDRPEILEIYYKGKGKPKRWDKYSEAEKKAFSFFSSTLALLERVWFGVPEKDWIDYYSKWVKDLATNDVFLDVFNDSKKIYDVSFTREIDAIINGIKEKG
jgi:pheromone shutdown protein TraB